MTTHAEVDSEAFWIGSVPSNLEVTLDGDFDLATVTSTTAALSDPLGVDVPGATAVLDAPGSKVTVTLPANPFTMKGMYTIGLTLKANAVTEVVEPVPLVVQAQDGWLSLEQARSMWAQAPDEDPTLFMLLESAKSACVAFAPAMEPGELVPLHYKQAQFQQARASWLAMSATTDSQIGDDTFSITVFPLDWNVKQLLRPKTIPVMF